MAEQAPAAVDGDRAHLPADALQLTADDRNVDDGAGVGAAPVELGRQDLPGPPGERVKVDGPAEEVRAVDGDLPDPAEADEDAPPLQRHHQPERARRLVPGGRQDHHVADPADDQVLAVQQWTVLQPGREYLAAGHACALRSSRSWAHQTIMVASRRTLRIR